MKFLQAVSLQCTHSPHSHVAVLDFALYEEVEAYTGQRPVVIFGVLADQVVNSLLVNSFISAPQVDS